MPPQGLLVPTRTKLKYAVHRVWTATPPSGGSNQVHDLLVQAETNAVASTSGQHWTTVDLKILKFSGRDLSGTETAHLKQIAPEIEKEDFYRDFHRKRTPMVWQGMATSNSGWAGLMAAKAIGMFEVGFLDGKLPSSSPAVGQTWTEDIPFGDDAIYGPEGFRPDIHDVKGTTAHCRFTVKSLDAATHSATVTFTGTANISLSYRDVFTGKPGRMTTAETQSGEWTLNLETRIPRRFHADRTSKSSAPNGTATTRTVTDVKLVE